jgi:hypothetical protein
MTTIIVAAGLCSAVRPRLLTALPPEKYPSVRITAWGEGHWHVDCSDWQVFPDDDPWVKRHIAHIDVTGADSFAAWVEYVACRAIATEKGGAGAMYLLSKPLNPRNLKWAAKYDSLPSSSTVWRQPGCQAQAHTPPKQHTAKAAAPAKTTQPRAKRKPARAPKPRPTLAGALQLRRQR